MPRTDRDYALTVGLRMLTLRHLVLEEQGLYRVNAAEMPVVAYYANSIAHLTRKHRTKKPKKRGPKGPPPSVPPIGVNRCCCC